jgi:FtsZ-binding cell division protein ZapB
MYKKIENNPGYLRDVATSGIISIDNDGLQAYKRQREYAKVQNNTIDEMSKRINSMNLEVQNIKHNSTSVLSNDINSIKQEMREIRDMIASILTKK